MTADALKRIEALERRVAALEGQSCREPLAGETLFKAWAQEESRRCGVSVTAIYNRQARGKYPNLPVRRVSGRLRYVMT